VSLIRKRAQVLGVVEAASREAAEAAAVRTFGLSNEQRKRLVVQERGPFSGMTVVKQVAVSIAVAVITVAFAEYVAWVLGQSAP